MARSLRDRFFTPPVARAMTSPLGIVLAGAGAAVGVATGLGVVGAIGLGALAWGGRVVAAIPRGDKHSTRIDPFALSEPWRGYVQGSLAAQARFERTVEATPKGPLRIHLADIGTRLEQGVEEVWLVASRGDDIDGGLATLDVRQAQAELARLDHEPAGSHTAATRDALAAQVATAARMQAVSTDARDRLRLLDARLDELVARAVELSVSGSASAITGLGDDVDSLVTEMEALRQALEEADRAEEGGAAGPPQEWPGP
jgi:hypothetical protein